LTLAKHLLSELHIHCKSLLTGVQHHAGCKEYWKGFTLALKMFDAFDKKQMYDDVITGKENVCKLRGMNMLFRIVLYQCF